MSLIDGLVWRAGGYPLGLRRLQLLRLAQRKKMQRLEDHCAQLALTNIGGRVVQADVITILPTYRRPDLLKRAMASALEQDVPDHHVIVVDDGAGLPKDLSRDPRVTALSLPVNTGTAGLVRNVGLRVSDSTYVAFLDDDNTWTPEHLRVSLAAHTGQVMLSYTGIRRMFSDGRVFDVLNEPWSRQRMKRYSYVDMSAVVVRRHPGMALSRIPRTGEDIGEDWQFVWEVSAHHPVVHVPHVTVNYLVDQPGIFSPWRAKFIQPVDAQDAGLPD